MRGYVGKSRRGAAMSAVVAIGIIAIAPAGHGEDFGELAATMWAPFVEWSVENPTCEGSPFDLMAKVTFTHTDSGARHITEMFYAGGTTWRFRFTGTKAGEWTFTTTSEDPELSGHTGRVQVDPNPNPAIRGFLTHQGNKFAIQQRDADDLEGYLFVVYMNGRLLPEGFPGLADPAKLEAVLDDTAANGFEIAFTYLCHNWLKLGTLRHDEHDSENPDLQTFDLLDQIITAAHARGMRWHLWAWGDEARKWTPIGLPGGINGPVDRRLQRYIAARLGPLPGWTMGYGFDLIEWTSEEGRNGWASFLHEKMGWDHLLCTRGFRLAGTKNNITSYSGFGGNDLTTSRCGPADYAEVARHIDADLDRPSFYEERHSYLREGFKLDMTGTRRLRWWQAMAGGLGGFFGFYEKSAHPYPNPEQLRTVQRFWQDRFTLDMVRCNDITDGCGLKDESRSLYVFYKEDADHIEVDLSSMPTAQRAIAVDAARAYAEVDLGGLAPGRHTLGLPARSDWAIAVGGAPDKQEAASPPKKPSAALVQNGWLVQDGRAIWGWVQHNGWWRPGQRANLTRRSVGDPKGDVRPNRTEDLDKLTDSMLRYGYPGFEHNYGLWYDRRRDAHDTARRTDPNVVPPFLEQPWARTSQEGSDPAWDGLPKYDLEQSNPWYFERLKAFADLCDEKGTVLIHKCYMQHALLETPAHYVDFPWRPANCIQDTGLPDGIPAANTFYDVTDPERRRLHTAYIRHCLDVLGKNRNVIFLTSQEFTGPLPFVEFWLDTIVQWERDTGRKVTIGLGAPKNVQDAILADPVRGKQVDAVDLRYWWQRADGTLFAPEGGKQMAGRGFESGSQQAKETSPQSFYQKVRRYRDRFPEKAIIDAYEGDRRASWAFLMAGGSLLVRGQICYPNQVDPPDYIQPAEVEAVLPTYRFIRNHLASRLPAMTPCDLVRENPDRTWCLAQPGQTYLVYASEGGNIALDLSGTTGQYLARWFDPRSGELTQAEPGLITAGGQVSFGAPDAQDWALWLARE